MPDRRPLLAFLAIPFAKPVKADNFPFLGAGAGAAAAISSALETSDGGPLSYPRREIARRPSGHLPSRWYTVFPGARLIARNLGSRGFLTKFPAISLRVAKNITISASESCAASLHTLSNRRRMAMVTNSGSSTRTDPTSFLTRSPTCSRRTFDAVSTARQCSFMSKRPRTIRRMPRPTSQPMDSRRQSRPCCDPATSSDAGPSPYWRRATMALKMQL
mmetsp:Transcript_6675/g.17175  ORF Transcript_6675/g.17175 Transcript_6675/m.17175 type:complete len:218 (-) Transcript_6675:88-741(-)